MNTNEATDLQTLLHALSDPAAANYDETVDALNVLYLRSVDQLGTSFTLPQLLGAYTTLRNLITEAHTRSQLLAASSEAANTLLLAEAPATTPQEGNP